MASLADWIKSQTADYGQLKEAYPNAMKFGSALKKGISQLVPTQEDLNSPQKMGEWGLSAALNAPMGMMFVGPKSAGWNATKAAEAEKLLSAGADPAQVWKEHLIGRMPDKSLFSEISDVEAKLLDKDTLNSLAKKDPYNVYNAPINESLTHQELFAKYPELNKINAYYDAEAKDYLGASFDPINNEVTLGAGLNNNQLKSGALHELQHAIQDKEGWAKGGSPDNPPLPFMDEINKIRAEKSKLNFDPYAISNKITSGYHVPEEQLLKYKKWEGLQSQEDDLLGQATKITPMQAYRRLTGEAQARATQDRMNMNMQQRRESYPLANDMLSDIPLRNLINRYK